ncbi:MAG: cupin domain-containing protein, partial [Gammaproteobacteria bacterium]
HVSAATIRDAARAKVRDVTDRARDNVINAVQPLAPTAPASLRSFIAAALGFEWNSLAWNRGIPGLRLAHLQDKDDERIWLLHAKPGVVIPEHTHSGAELTLIVHGAYCSDGKQFNAGDLDDNDEGVTHHQTVTRDSDCISLLVFEGRHRYTGWMGLAQRILKF